MNRERKINRMNNDTISRQALMKEFSDFVRESNNSDFAPTPTWNDAVSLVGSMPSADIAPRWIPVTDRLPEQEGQYLVCCNNKHHQFEVARFYINYDGDRWFCCDWNDPEKIIAWMPLPEPYKGGVEE